MCTSHPASAGTWEKSGADAVASNAKGNSKANSKVIIVFGLRSESRIIMGHQEWRARAGSNRHLIYTITRRLVTRAS
jgi:hypothetical protein